MAHYTEEEINVCDDCVIAISNDDYSGIPDELIEGIEKGVKELLEKGYVSFGDSESSSSEPCECCGSNLYGNRRSSTLLIKEPDTFRGLNSKLMGNVKSKYINAIDDFFKQTEMDNVDLSKILYKFLHSDIEYIREYAPTLTSKMNDYDITRNIIDDIFTEGVSYDYFNLYKENNEWAGAHLDMNRELVAGVRESLFSVLNNDFENETPEHEGSRILQHVVEFSSKFKHLGSLDTESINGMSNYIKKLLTIDDDYVLKVDYSFLDDSTIEDIKI